MNDMELLRRPVKGSDVVRRRPSTPEAREAIGALVATIATVNDALDQIESSADVYPALHGELVGAVSQALECVPDIEAMGIRFGRVDGKERLVVNPEALAEGLRKDPHALDALLSGDHRLSETLSAALASEPDLPAEPAPAVETVHPAHVIAQMRTMQLLDSAPSRARRRLDWLV
jgi:hypothetical protein